MWMDSSTHKLSTPREMGKGMLGMKSSGDSLNKLLLVEDNPMDVDLTKRAFAMNNLPVTIDVASDGEEAIGYIKKWEAGWPLPKVILLDLKLPKVNGLEVLRFIKEDPRTRIIPVVLLTSSKEEEDIIQGYQLGVSSYVVKPVDFDIFIQSIAELAKYWLDLNQPPRLKVAQKASLN